MQTLFNPWIMLPPKCSPGGVTSFLKVPLPKKRFEAGFSWNLPCISGLTKMNDEPVQRIGPYLDRQLRVESNGWIKAQAHVRMLASKKWVRYTDIWGIEKQCYQIKDLLLIWIFLSVLTYFQQRWCNFFQLLEMCRKYLKNKHLMVKIRIRNQ